MLVKGLCLSSITGIRCFSSISSRILKVGDILKETRTFSYEDLLEFSKVSHDSNTLHFDSECARSAGFEDRIVHGMLVAALFPRIISSNFPGAVYVSQSLNFKLPVYIGDEIVGRVEATKIRENNKKYISKFSTKCFKNGDDLVLEGEATAILPNLDIK